MNRLTFILVPFFFLTLLQFSPGINALQIHPSPRIVYGLNAAKGQFPWQVYLETLTPYGNITGCGGSLISSRWVLTAAQCIQGALDIKVNLGIVDFEDYSSTRVLIHASNWVTHESYSSQFSTNDIAAVYLSTPVTLSQTIKPIKVSSKILASGIKVTVSGWGRTTDYSDQINQYLNYVSLTTVTNKQCGSNFGIDVLFSEQRVCAKGAYIQSACDGDNGGPLITGSGDQAELVGIVSFGSPMGCAKGFPSVYVRTAYYRDWIKVKTEI